MFDMRRREFITLLGGAAAWPVAARAQQAERVRKVGVLAPATAGTPLWQGYLAAFREELQKLGWSQPNVAIEERWGVNAEQVRSHAAELVAMAPDVILGGAATGTRALQQATRTIPIVFAFVPDPVALGFVTSLARPGGNITGFANYEPIVAVKWLELLKQIAPGITRVTFIHDPVNPVVPAYMRQLETAASSFAVTMSGATVRNAEDIERALNHVAQAPNSGLIVAPGPPVSSYQTLVQIPKGGANIRGPARHVIIAVAAPNSPHVRPARHRHGRLRRSLAAIFFGAASRAALLRQFRNIHASGFVAPSAGGA